MPKRNISKKTIAGDKSPAVIILKSCRVYYHRQFIDLKEGNKVEGKLAKFLIRTGASVKAVK